jgi:hypothetical protein
MIRVMYFHLKTEQKFMFKRKVVGYNSHLFDVSYRVALKK